MSNINELRKEYEKAYKQEIRKDEMFEKVIEIGRKNSLGKLWIVGGYVYRKIIEKIYGNKTSRDFDVIDVDFLAEQLNMRQPYVPEGWELKITDYTNPYLVKDNYRVDLNDMRNFHSILVRNLSPRISHFFTGTPLNIESIAWDCDEKNIFGKRGIESISRRVVKVNNMKEAKYEAKKRGVSVEKLIRKKAEQLGFDFIIPSVLKQST